MAFDRLKRSMSHEDSEAAANRLAETFDQALVQRSKLFLSFDEGVTSLGSITGTVHRFTRHSLFVETTSISSASSRWNGSTATCYFKLHESRPRPRDTFYMFRTTLVDSRPGRQGAVMLELAFPASLESGQRRKSIRVTPDRDKFKQVVLWRYGQGQSLNLREPLAGMKQFQNGAAILQDISAGGVSLVLKKSLIKEQGLEVSSKPRFVMFMRFSESLPRYPEAIWLVAKTKFVETDFVTGDVRLGLEFIGEGVADSATGKVSWRKVVDHTVENVAQRTYQWHIELYRDKGIV